MYAYRTIRPINGLHIDLDLPAEFRACATAEIIVLPAASLEPTGDTWRERVMALAGILGDDFPDDVTDSDLGGDAPRESLE